MPGDSASAVLHITAAAGGGADRYIRDLAASTTRRHFVLHAGPAVDVLEDIRGRRFLPLREPAGHIRGRSFGRWSKAADIGLVHLHGVDLLCRERLASLLSARSLPYVVTLHDLLFMNPRAFESPGMPVADSGWIAELAGTLLRASIVIAPSTFIRGIALRCLPGISTAVISPGIRVELPTTVPLPPPQFASQSPGHIVAVVGAVGPHKGSGLLEALAVSLDGGELGIAVIGYTDTTLTPGWVVPGRIYVHGPYLDNALAGWLAAYRTDIVLFPNRLPESFSYTLSEVWAAGIPVIVPDDGALGERVATLGGGWRLPPGFTGADAAALLARLFSPEGHLERARVESAISPLDPARIPTLEAMSRDVDALYARFALSSATTTDADAARDALAPLLAANLDGFVFRKELLSLAGQLERAMADVAEARRWSAQLERDGAAWAAKLEADIATLRREYTVEIARLTEETRRLGKHSAGLALDNRRLGSQNARLDEDNRRLGKENVRLDEQVQRMAQISGQLEEAKAALFEARQRSAQQERDLAERAAKYRDELAILAREHAEENRRLADEIAWLAKYKAAFELGPELAQKYLLRKLSRGRR